MQKTRFDLDQVQPGGLALHIGQEPHRGRRDSLSPRRPGATYGGHMISVKRSIKVGSAQQGR
jgi:hypothetical protein